MNDDPSVGFDLVYQEIRAIAGSILQRSGKTPRTIADLGVTTVVHEAWLKLRKTNDWDSRAHFFGSAARAIRQVLVDYAPKGSRVQPLRAESLSPVAEPHSEPLVIVQRVHQALLELERVNPRCGHVAELKLFGDLSVKMISSIVGISERAVARDWRFARVWLAERIGDDLAGE